MVVALTDTRPALRQRIASRTPRCLRKSVRMALNYTYRLGMWRNVLSEMQPVGSRSRCVLWFSALAAPITALRNLDSYKKPVLVSDVTVTVTRVGRFHVRAGTDDLLHVMMSREPELRRFIEGHLQLGGTFVDGGANIGFYSLLAARQVGANGMVVAFEMMPDTAAILRRHISENGPLSVDLMEKALSDRSGCYVAASVKPGQHGQASIVTNAGAERCVVQVETVTLDEALAHLGKIDLIKLDLEGAEYLALSGAEAVLRRTACLIFESNEMDSRIFTLLDAAGFTVERLAGFDFVARRNPKFRPNSLA